MPPDTRLVFFACALCSITVAPVAVGTGVAYTPKINGFSAKVADLDVDVFSPISVGVTDEGGVIALDALVRSIVVSEGPASAGAESHPAGHGVPYSQVVCDRYASVVVSYVAGTLVETFPLRGGGGGGAARPQLGALFDDAGAGGGTGGFISDMTANSECSLFYFLDGVHKTVHVANETVTGWELRTLGDETGVLQTLTTPTGLELFEGELFVADWGAGAIVSLQLERTGGANATRVVGSSVVAGVGVQRPMRDGGGLGPSPPAQLAGPTQLTGFMAGTGLLFTDRNPSLHASALRLLRTSGPPRGRVVTLAGGNLRGHVNGGSQRALFGGVWGVGYKPLTGGEIVVSEPATGRVLRFSDAEIEWATCHSGTAASVVRASAVSCLSCAAGWWCPGDNQAHHCTGGRTSAPGSNNASACECPPGTSVGANGLCARCPADHYCLPGMQPARCAATFVAPAGSRSPDACVCPRRYYKDTESGLCRLCTPGSYCVAGTRHACSATGVGVDTVPGAWHAANCSCKNGYKRMRGGASGECERCATGEVCWYTLVLDMEVVVMLECGHNLLDVLDEVQVKAMVLGAGVVAPWVQSDDISVDVALEYTCGGHNTRRLMQAGFELDGGSELTMAMWRLRTRISMKGVNKEDVGELQSMWTTERINGASGGGLGLAVVAVDAQSVLFSGASMRAMNESDCAMGHGGQVVESVCVCGHGYVGVPPRCTPCSMGRFKGSLGYGVCIACPAHSHTREAGARSRAECVCDVNYERVPPAGGDVDEDQDPVFSCAPSLKRHFIGWGIVVGGITCGVLVFILCGAFCARLSQRGHRQRSHEPGPRGVESSVMQNVRLRRREPPSPQPYLV